MKAAYKGRLDVVRVLCMAHAKLEIKSKVFAHKCYFIRAFWNLYKRRQYICMNAWVKCPAFLCERSQFLIFLYCFCLPKTTRRTALVIAALKKRVEVVKFLLQWGADPAAMNKVMTYIVYSIYVLNLILHERVQRQHTDTRSAAVQEICKHRAIKLGDD